MTRNFLWLPMVGVAAILAVIGTDRLGRLLSDDERRTLGALLREHDYPAARLVALRFAYKLTRSRPGAQDLLGRVDARLLRQGWDPGEVTLVRALCRMTWSEWTHATGESDKTRRAEESHVRESEALGGTSAPSTEGTLLEHAARERACESARAQLARLRASFEAAGDSVNVLWLDAAMADESGLPDAQALAARTGRDVTEFYAAAKRRKRAVLRILAEDRGVEPDEDADGSARSA